MVWFTREINLKSPNFHLHFEGSYPIKEFRIISNLVSSILWWYCLKLLGYPNNTLLECIKIITKRRK